VSVGEIKPGASARPRVVILRGHQPNVWELYPWQLAPMAENFDVSYVRSGRGWFDTRSLELDSRRVWTMRDLLPPGRTGDLAVRVPGDRYLGLAGALRGAAVVHAQELGYWYSAQAARLKRRLGFRLVLTVWETIPLLDAYRNVRTRPYRSLTLRETDLFLAITERAREALLLEGAAPERIRVCPPGIDFKRFAAATARKASGVRTILSPGRLVWEKGHQDVLRALAVLRRGATGDSIRAVFVGTGPDEDALRSYARDLGVADLVEFRGFVPYDKMPEVYLHADCVVLASLPTWSWEEQFGMVLAESIAAGLPVIASTCGAIPEVIGERAHLFSPGDWQTLANRLGEVLSGNDPRVEASPPHDYSADAAARRIAAAYRDLLSGGAG
jgi:glycosyltransferase involved in cell wall biosynthesis